MQKKRGGGVFLYVVGHSPDGVVELFGVMTMLDCTPFSILGLFWGGRDPILGWMAPEAGRFVSSLLEQEKLATRDCDRVLTPGSMLREV